MAKELRNNKDFDQNLSIFIFIFYTQLTTELNTEMLNFLPQYSYRKKLIKEWKHQSCPSHNKALIYLKDSSLSFPIKVCTQKSNYPQILIYIDDT